MLADRISVTAEATTAALVAALLVAAFVMPAPAAAQPAPDCADAVQGEVAWNYEGDTRWASSNVQRLCRGAEDSPEPARCFEEVMHGNVSWGGGTRWQWENALSLCQGTRDADATVRCFERRIEGGTGWREAIEACEWDGSGDGAWGGPNPPFPLPDSLPLPRPRPEDDGASGAEAIAAKYRALGGRSGRLGPPDAPVRTNPDETGMRRRYANGHIYWHPDTGAHPIYDGPIWEQWADQRWEEGELGYPVSDPRPREAGHGTLQLFQGGTLRSTGVVEDEGPTAWDEAGSENFSIRPVAEAEHCVADVPAAFDDIAIGRRSGRNFYTHHVGRASDGHMQGVARLPGGWLAQAYSKGMFLSHFPGQEGSGHDVWATGPRDGVPTFPRLPDVRRKHVGGLHAYGNVVVLPSEPSRVEIFRHRSGKLELLTSLDVSEHQPGAHFASIVPLTGGDWLLAVGRDSRRRRKAHRVYFYVLPSLDADQSQLRYLGRRGRGRTVEDFQSGSLVAECDGDVYFIGTGNKFTPANQHAKLYRVVSFSRSGGGNPDRANLSKVTERSPASERNDCNTNAAATFFPTDDRALAMYCTEKNIKNGSVTTREYRP